MVMVFMLRVVHVRMMMMLLLLLLLVRVVVMMMMVLVVMMLVAVVMVMLVRIGTRLRRLVRLCSFFSYNSAMIHCLGLLTVQVVVIGA